MRKQFQASVAKAICSQLSNQEDGPFFAKKIAEFKSKEVHENDLKAMLHDLLLQTKKYLMQTYVLEKS